MLDFFGFLVSSSAVGTMMGPATHTVGAMENPIISQQIPGVVFLHLRYGIYDDT
jgi:hypothetical protein